MTEAAASRSLLALIDHELSFSPALMAREFCKAVRSARSYTLMHISGTASRRPHPGVELVVGRILRRGALGAITSHIVDSLIVSRHRCYECFASADACQGASRPAARHHAGRDLR